MKIKTITIISLTILFLMSCSATKKAPRKCDGKKGIRTNMGTM